MVHSRTWVTADRPNERTKRATRVFEPTGPLPQPALLSASAHHANVPRPRIRLRLAACERSGASERDGEHWVRKYCVLAEGFVQ